MADAARRVSDACRAVIAAHSIDEHRPDQWMAFDFGTGEPFPMQAAPTVFDNKLDAIRHTGNRARKFMYLKVPWDDVSPRAAAVFLLLHRQLSKIGQHPEDRERGSEWMTDTRREAYPSLDARRVLMQDHQPSTPGGLILPRGNHHVSGRRHRPGN